MVVQVVLFASAETGDLAGEDIFTGGYWILAVIWQVAAVK